MTFEIFGFDLTDVITVAIIIGIGYLIYKIYGSYKNKQANTENTANTANTANQVSPTESQKKENLYIRRPRWGRRIGGCPYGRPAYLYNWQPYGTYLW